MGKFATSKNGNIASGTEVLANNMVFLQQTKEEAISNLFGDLFGTGILNLNNEVLKLTANNGGAYAGSFNVQPGIAYIKDDSVTPSIYRRVEISYEESGKTNDPSLPLQQTDDGTGTMIDTPKNPGSHTIFPTNDNNVYYVDLRYLSVCDNGNDGSGLGLTNYSIAKKANPSSTDEVKRFYKWIDGYDIKLVSSTTDIQGVCLGTVQRNGDTVTITQNNRASNLLIKNKVAPLAHWGIINGVIWEQTDLAEILFKGLSYDSAVVTEISGYSKGTILKFNYELNHFDIKSVLDNNNEQPNINNIYFPRKITEIVAKIQDATELPSPSEEQYNQIYWIIESNTIAMCYQEQGVWGWYFFPTTALSTNGICHFQDTDDYYKYNNNTSQWINLSTTYKWLFFSQLTIIKEYSNNSTNQKYRLWSNGWIEQYGKKVFEDGQYSTNFDVTFAIEMEDDSYHPDAICGRNRTDGSINFGFGVRNKTTTGMNIQILETGSNDRCYFVNWKIEGYAKDFNGEISSILGQ